MHATVEQIQRDPAEYLERVLQGETVVVYKEDRPIAEIRPLTETGNLRPIGLAAGEFTVPDDFDEPLPEDVLDDFEGK